MIVILPAVGGLPAAAELPCLGLLQRKVSNSYKFIYSKIHDRRCFRRIRLILSSLLEDKSITAIFLGHCGSVSRLNFGLGPLSFRHCGGMTGAPPGSIGQADLEGNHSYKFIYSRVFAADPHGCN
jgi:hypothetical protein